MLPFITETETVWQILARAEKPVVLYGMGLGAEKILREMNARGISDAGVFASDGFVRGHCFAGFPVRSYAETVQAFGDFIILVSFASEREEVLSNIFALSERHSLYAPWLPVTGEGFTDFAYLAAHEAELLQAYSLLADAQSRTVFAAVLNHRLSGKISGLRAVTTPKADGWALVEPRRTDAYLDLGAYDGDTIREVTALAGGALRRVVALEPDPKNFRKLTAFTAEFDGTVDAVNAGIFSRDCTLLFSNKAGRHSSVSRDGRGMELPMRSIDSLADGEPFTLIKLDVEGEERAAIAGGQEQLARYAPRLVVSAYHRMEDLFSLVNQIHAIQPRYRFYLRQHPYIPAWDTTLYAVGEGTP